MNNQAELTFWFDDDLDGTGQLSVEASANGFSGVGRAYISKSQIEDFADALTAYPLKKENLPEFNGGYGEPDTLRLKVYPVNGRGDLAIQVKLATELWNEERIESQHSVQLEILTHYQPVADLSKELKDLINGKISKAVLNNS